MRLEAAFPLARRAHERQLAHALRSVPLLRELPAADLVAIWRCLSETRAPAGTALCRKGEPGEHFYLVQVGALTVLLRQGPSAIPIRRLGPGDFVGEMSLLTGAPRSADVVVVEDAVLWVLSRQDFTSLLATRRSLAQAFNRVLCERVVQLTALLEERGTGEVGGLRAGPYRAVEQIGVGGMAAVYSAIHTETEAAVALKVLPVGWGTAEEMRERLAREAAMLQQVRHPNVIQVLEVGALEQRFGGGCYLALEWIPHALDRVLRAQYPEPLALGRALRLAQCVAEALAAVHAAGLIHRDVKPSNILLRADGSPVLTDFGLAAALNAVADEHRLTPPNLIIGTADYISPEQVAGLPVDGRADLYALGVVLYEMVAGYVPFAGLAPLETVRAQVEKPPPPLPASVPKAVRVLVERALQKKADDRFPSAAAMAEELATARAAVCTSEESPVESDSYAH